MTIEQLPVIENEAYEAELNARNARRALDPVRRNATATALFTFEGKLSMTTPEALAAEVDRLQRLAQSDNTGFCERTLFAQATSLDTVSAFLIDYAGRTLPHNFNQAERCLLLALKAQNQSRLTIETMRNIKNPRQVVITRQANISQGHQQVNNPPNELLEHEHGKQRLDTGKACSPGRRNSRVAAVAKVHGATDKPRKGASK